MRHMCMIWDGGLKMSINLKNKVITANIKYSCPFCKKEIDYKKEKDNLIEILFPYGGDYAHYQCNFLYEQSITN